MPLARQSESNSVVPSGHIRCLVTGELRRDTPEENVRQRWIRSLVSEYKYNINDLAVEFPIKMGVSRKRADIVIFRPDESSVSRDQDRILIVVEVKRENVSVTDRLEGVEQLKSYMSACSGCKYGLWVGSEKTAYERTLDGTIDEIHDIPRLGETQLDLLLVKDLIPAIDLQAALRRCHNYIYTNQGIQRAEAFHELQKLLFCKVLDESDVSGSLRFVMDKSSRTSIAAQKDLQYKSIVPLFEKVKERYPYIFESGESIKLNPRVLAYIVSELQKYAILRTTTDIKGAAYEELVGANLRGDRGEFFTPRNVCDMAVGMVFSLFQPRRLDSLKVLDCCCGTGGFLVAAMNCIKKSIESHEKSKGGSEEEIRGNVAARVKELSERNLFGMDINPFLVRTTQMNLVMHGDGSANVFRGDSLALPSEWQDEEAGKKIKQDAFDVCITNPPFGGQAYIDDPHTLSRFDLCLYETDVERKRMPAEQLFVEGALRYVKPGGYLAIVLPDSILNNPSLRFLRQWLLRNSRIKASIDLPKETFAASGGVPNPSLLIVQRLTESDAVQMDYTGEIEDYDVFMAIPKAVGKDKRGVPIYLRTPDGSIILDNDDQPIIDDELPYMTEAFRDWSARDERDAPI